MKVEPVGKQRIRLDPAHIDPETGQPFDNPNAAVPQVHGYDEGGDKIRDPETGDSHFPLVPEDAVPGVPEDAPMTSHPKVYRLAGGDIVVWQDESGTIFLKVQEKYGDPVELAEHEAKELAELLIQLAQESQSPAPEGRCA